MSEPDLTEQARASWESVASGWEENRDRAYDAFAHVSEWLIGQIDAQPGHTVLDIAAGPGETGFVVAERVGEGGQLISTDISASMVDSARRGAQARGLVNVDCRVMDAQALDLEDDSVDRAISRLGFMLVPDPAMAFREVRRVLRDDGRLAYGVIGSPTANQWIGLMMMAFVAKGHAPIGDPFGAGGPFSLSDPERNRSLLEDAGFTDVTITELTGAMHFDGADDYWNLQSRMCGPIPALVKTLSAEQVAEVRASLPDLMAPFAVAEGGFELPSNVVGVSAR